MNRKIISIIAAILFSLVLWGSITLSNSFFTTIKVPVKLINLPRGYAVGSISAKNVNIRVKGEGWRLVSVVLRNDDEYLVSAGLDSMGKSVNLKNALAENAWLSSGIQLMDIYPDILTFRLERMVEKKVRIKPDLNLGFKPDYGLASSVNVTPDSILVTGPKSLVSRLEEIPTVKRDFVNLDENVTDRVELLSLNGLNYSRNFCTVKFDVQKIVDRSFENLEVKVNNVPRGEELVIFPNTISIVLRGGINVLGRLKEEDFHPFVDYNETIRDTLGFIVPDINIPGFTTIIDKKPNKLKYIIKKY
ncbi:MAG: YbbR-like domain-containing protein [Ignavibacteriales bacterium]